MKRFPRAVPGALALMGLLVSSEGCSPDQSVKPGAPVLTKLTIVEYTPAFSNATDITADVKACKTGVAAGGECRLVAQSAPADGGVADGGTLAEADPALCLLGASDWCRCQGDPSASELGAWNCDPFAPTSIVLATFDRLLDTAPFEADGGVPADEIATLTASPPPPTPISPLVDYSSTGSAVSIVFSLYGPFWGTFVTGNPYDNNYRSFGPSIQVGGSPALPSGSTISIDLSKMNVRAKDGKTPFTGAGFLKDGSINFNTAAFSATITHPVGDPLPPADPDAGTGAAVSDAGAPDGGASDASPPPPLPTTGPVPADMNAGPVLIAFNNVVDVQTIAAHITVTENGLPFTGYTVDASGNPTITVTPTDTWAAGKAYTVTVNASTADATGVKLPKAESITFVMAN